jgi:bifunctional non-homologous end joining protein LigD
MIKELRRIRATEPACQKRSDGDHLRFVIYKKRDEEKFDFTIELNGTKSWLVPDVPSMNPMHRCEAEEEGFADDIGADESLAGVSSQAWDSGNYIPIDDCGNALSELEALRALREGSLKFFLQGKKLVGQFVLLQKEESNWLLMKRHDEFAQYSYYSYELLEG